MKHLTMKTDETKSLLLRAWINMKRENSPHATTVKSILESMTDTEHLQTAPELTQ